MLLPDLQRAFQARILTRGAGVEDELKGTRNTDFASRLDVYVEGYRARLVEVLGTTYPVLMNTLGEQEFARQMREYVDSTPSRHYSVRYYGASVADHVDVRAGGVVGEALGELAPVIEPVSGEMLAKVGFIFVSSANGVTPFHIDYEENFFVHLHGEKFMHVFDNRDRSLVSEQDLETFPGKHRNHEYREDFERKATVNRFEPGEGVFLPYTWPHWVRTGPEWTISMAITWKSPQDLRMNQLYFANAVLRKMGLPQPAPGRRPRLDAMKIAAFSAAQAVVRPLRRSEGMRRTLRALFFGKKANYYYGAGKA